MDYRRTRPRVRWRAWSTHAFGTGSPGLTLADFLGPEIVVQPGYLPVRIDRPTSISGVLLREARDNPVLIDSADRLVGFIASNDFIPTDMRRDRAGT